MAARRGPPSRLHRRRPDRSLRQRELHSIYGKGRLCQAPRPAFTGSGGANGIATFCNTIIMMQHQKRRFMEKIDYITSCGWMDGPGGRERAGLPGNRGPQMVVTDLGIMKFDEETKRGCIWPTTIPLSPEMVQENTGFEVDVSRAQLFGGPSPEIIRVIRRGDRPRPGLYQGPQGIRDPARNTILPT